MAVSLNHDIKTSCWLHMRPRTPNLEPSEAGIPVWGCCPIPMATISMCPNTLYMSNEDVGLNHEVIHWYMSNDDVGSSLRWLSASQPWHNDIIVTPQVTQNPNIWPQVVGYKIVWGYCHMPMDSIYMCSNTVYMSNMDAGSNLRWLSASTIT